MLQRHLSPSRQHLEVRHEPRAAGPERLRSVSLRITVVPEFVPAPLALQLRHERHVFQQGHLESRTRRDDVSALEGTIGDGGRPLSVWNVRVRIEQTLARRRERWVEEAEVLQPRPVRW